jgi:hypothetical protein
MAAIAEDQRIGELRRLGMSEPLIRLSSGEILHDLFRHSCLGPPYYIYHGAGTPGGPLLAPLWDCNDTVVGVWDRHDGPEFIEFSIEADDEYWALARTEQGFWAAQFDFFYEMDTPLDEMRDAAGVVGFRFLDRHLSARQATDSRLGTFQAHQTWLRDLVAGIDRESQGAL